jgi:membrane protease YdiL (CAAX protease family)
VSDHELETGIEGTICPNCNKSLPQGAKFCKSCGFKLPIPQTRTSSKSEWRKVKKKLLIEQTVSRPKINAKEERFCPKCNAIIKSVILEQCPICLNEVPLNKEQSSDKKPEKMVFTGQKLITERNLKKDKNKWNIRESMSVSLNSILLYGIIQSLVLVYFLYFSAEPIDSIPINEFTVIIGPVISMSLGLFPIFYILKNKHKFAKLGFSKNYILLLVFLGIVCGVFLFYIELFSDLILTPIIEGVWSKPPIIEEERNFILNMGLGFQILFSIAIIFDNVLEEILFRGVVQNSFSDYFSNKNGKGSKILPKIKSILTTSAIQLAFYLFFTFNPYYFVVNLIPSLILSIFYEIIDRKMTGLVLLKISYSIIGLASYFLLL